jgi:hypothetical protein
VSRGYFMCISWSGVRWLSSQLEEALSAIMYAFCSVLE